MAKITVEQREKFNKAIEPYQARISQSFEKEKDFLQVMQRDTTGTGYKKMLLVEEMLSISFLYMAINSLSVEILSTKNNDALNDARKILYKAVIYLEEVVTNTIDSPFSEYEKSLSHISNIPLEKRYELIRKLGLAIRLLTDAYGENTKWKWSFVELEARYATVAKNLLDLKEALRVYAEPRETSYDITVYYLRLIKELLEKAATEYRDKYELSTLRLDDMRLAIQYLLALRRMHILLGEPGEAEEVKKKALVWKSKLENDQKKGICK